MLRLLSHTDLTVTRPQTGCPICHARLKRRERVVICGHCGVTVHHGCYWYGIAERAECPAAPEQPFAFVLCHGCRQ